MANLLGYDVVDSVTTALNDAGYNDQTTQEVMIQSKDSAVLVKLKQQQTKYKLVYTLPQDIGSASATSLVAVKEFADAVVVERNSVFALSRHFIIRQNDIVEQLQSVGLRTYVQVFSNDFVSPPWDFFSDGTAEINSYVQLINIDGFVTDSPKTVRRYKSKCHIWSPLFCCMMEISMDPCLHFLGGIRILIFMVPFSKNLTCTK
jgi:glycerophosphoryl diester phosphodiesterase